MLLETESKATKPFRVAVCSGYIYVIYVRKEKQQEFIYLEYYMYDVRLLLEILNV